MKFTLILATLAATVLAAPATDMPVEASLDARADNCFFGSQCSAFWSGKCENHCGKRGFSHMTRDGCNKLSLQKRCCCIKP